MPTAPYAATIRGHRRPHAICANTADVHDFCAARPAEPFFVSAFTLVPFLPPCVVASKWRISRSPPDFREASISLPVSFSTVKPKFASAVKVLFLARSKETVKNLDCFPF